MKASLKLYENKYEKDSHYIYEGGLKNSWPSIRKTQDKRPLDRQLDRSWCHRHTTSVIKLFWSQPVAPWASRAAYRQGEKFSA